MSNFLLINYNVSLLMYLDEHFIKFATIVKIENIITQDTSLHH